MGDIRARKLLDTPVAVLNHASVRVLRGPWHTALLYNAKGGDWPEAEGACAVVEFRYCAQVRVGRPGDGGFEGDRLTPSRMLAGNYEVAAPLTLLPRGRSFAERESVRAESQRALRHFMFVFRDETFECLAGECRLVGVFPAHEALREGMAVAFGFA